MRLWPSRAAEMLDEFHRSLGDRVGRGGVHLRRTLHKEESRELDDELNVLEEEVNPQQLARELADVVYVCYGTAHAFAIDLDCALRQIHQSNMSKVGPNKIVRGDGKVLKPDSMSKVGPRFGLRICLTWF